jgi:hypothetical protein
MARVKRSARNNHKYKKNTHYKRQTKLPYGNHKKTTRPLPPSPLRQHTGIPVQLFPPPTTTAVATPVANSLVERPKGDLTGYTYPPLCAADSGCQNSINASAGPRSYFTCTPCAAVAPCAFRLGRARRATTYAGLTRSARAAVDLGNNRRLLSHMLSTRDDGK